MPFRCVLDILPSAMGNTKSPLSQQSLLIFATRQEANLFARKMFETPHSVVSWKIEETAEKANYKYSDGRLKPL